MKSSPNLLGVLPFDHVSNSPTENVQKTLDIKVVGSLLGMGGKGDIVLPGTKQWQVQSILWY